jgi:eukaryotic-like serine/threonine-protein kinase
MDRREFFRVAGGGSFALALAGVSTPEADAGQAAQNTARGKRVVPGSLANRLKLKWKFKTGGPVVSSPTVANGRVYVGSGDDYVYAIGLNNGSQIWAFKTKGAVEATAKVEQNTVLIGSSDGRLYGLNTVNGKPRWQYPTDDKILGGANTIPAPNGKGTWVIVGSYDNRIHCVNLATGKKVWAFETENYINGTPAISDGKIIFGGCDGMLYVVRLSDGKKIQAIEIGDYIAGSATVDGRLAYLGHYGNAVICADLIAGKVVWANRDYRFPYFSTPAVTQDRVVIGGRDKRVHCLNRANGKEVWNFRTRGKVDSSPMICDGKVVVGSEDGKLYMLGLNDSKEIWSYQIGAPIISSPNIVNGTVLVGADDGFVYAFGAAG